jgi:hypothetical protein
MPRIRPAAVRQLLDAVVDVLGLEVEGLRAGGTRERHAFRHPVEP